MLDTTTATAAMQTETAAAEEAADAAEELVAAHERLTETLKALDVARNATQKALAAMVAK